MSNPFPSGVTTGVTWNGYDLHDYGLCIYEIRGRGIPRSEDYTDSIPGVDGQISWGQKLGPREISCRGYIMGADRAACLTNLAGIKALFRSGVYTSALAGGTADNQAIGAARVVFHDQTDRFWPANYSGIFQATDAMERWPTCEVMWVEVTFVCHKPYALSTNQQYAVGDASGSGEFDRAVRLTLGGVPIKPIVEIMGPATNPSVLMGPQCLHADFDGTPSGTYDFTSTEKVTDGDMEASGTTNWTAYGTSGVGKSGLYCSGGSQSLKVTPSTTDSGAKQTIAVSAGERYMVLVHVLKDTVANVYAEVYDATGAASITTCSLHEATTGHGIPYYFNRNSFVFEVPAGCSSIELRFLSESGSGIFYIDGVSMRQTVTDNGEFEGTYSSGVAPNWTKLGTWTATEETSTYHSGSKAQGIEGASDSSNCLYQNHSFTTGNVYIIRMNARRMSGLGDIIVDIASSIGMPAYSQFTIKTGPGWKMVTIVARANFTTSGAIKIYQADGSTKHIIDDFSVISLTSSTVNRITKSIVHGPALELDDNNTVLGWLAHDMPDDEWSLAIRFVPNWNDSNSNEIRDILTILWAYNSYARVAYDHGDYQTFLLDFAHDDGSDQWDRLVGDAWCCAQTWQPTGIVIVRTSSTVSMWIDGIKQANTLSVAAPATVDNTAYVYLPGAMLAEHLTFYGCALSDADASHASHSLTPPEDETKTLTYTGSVTAGQILELDFAKRTAKLRAAGSTTNVIANVGGDWGELKGDKSVVRLGATAGGFRVLYWPRYL